MIDAAELLVAYCIGIVAGIVAIVAGLIVGYFARRCHRIHIGERGWD